jgi:multidrug efflux system membrane fusion protein
MKIEKHGAPVPPIHPPERQPLRWRARHWLLGIGVLAGAGLYVAAPLTRPGVRPTTSAPKQVPPEDFRVGTRVARTGDIRVYLNGLGNAVPLNTVNVRPRVDGEVVNVLYREGQLVQRGDLLAEIDPRPFQIQLAQATGQLVRDQALLKNAQLNLERMRTLLQQNMIPRQQFDGQEALLQQYEGAVKVDNGVIDNAKLQLTYAHVTAPVAGRLGLRQIDLGNVVHANDPNGMVVITQLQPITVVFTIPEDSIPGVMNKLMGGAKLQVDAYDRAQKHKLASGSVLTVDNQIDPTTGAVKLKAQFANDDFSLFPNQFVNVRLLVDVKDRATIVPSAAIQRGSEGPFVYLVAANQTVTLRPVTPGATEGEDTEIVAGLKPGDVVVVEGADKLREGVSIKGRAQDVTSESARAVR